ncbi:hypothetical protein LCGC14_0295460 [marine sediment metagenome]|uniref:Uncharacterized protein n=1 Tax=marine sediment metagenome TaxID=412755 RepID=A0A0F9WXZ3_9ZZZZ
MTWCEECGEAKEDVGPLYPCDYCVKDLCFDCRPRKKHKCEER